jgi:hypothetical protein
MAKTSFSHNIDESFVVCFEQIVAQLGPPKYRILEVAIEVFDALSRDVQYRLRGFDQAEREPIFRLLGQLDKGPSDEQGPAIRESIEMVKHFVRYKVPSAKEQQLIDSLRKALGPDSGSGSKGRAQADHAAAESLAAKKRRKKRRPGA